MCEMKQKKDNEAVLIPKDILSANFDRKGYFARVAFHSGSCESYREAWEKTEEELEQHGLPPRYSSYESFTVHRSRWVRDMNSKR